MIVGMVTLAAAVLLAPLIPGITGEAYGLAVSVIMVASASSLHRHEHFGCSHRVCDPMLNLETSRNCQVTDLA